VKVAVEEDAELAVPGADDHVFRRAPEEVLVSPAPVEHVEVVGVGDDGLALLRVSAGIGKFDAAEAEDPRLSGSDEVLADSRSASEVGAKNEAAIVLNDDEERAVLVGDGAVQVLEAEPVGSCGVGQTPRLVLDLERQAPVQLPDLPVVQDGRLVHDVGADEVVDVEETGSLDGEVSLEVVGNLQLVGVPEVHEGVDSHQVRLGKPELVQMHFGLVFGVVFGGGGDGFLLFPLFLVGLAAGLSVLIADLDLEDDGDVVGDCPLALASLHGQVDLDDVAVRLLLLPRHFVVVFGAAVGAAAAAVVVLVYRVCRQKVRYTVGRFTDLQGELANLRRRVVHEERPGR